MYKIIEEKNYFMMIPNIVDDMGLSVYAFRLYAHLKRVAGDNGICWQSGETLAKNCGMSTGKITECKTELVNAGLIKIQMKTGSNGNYSEITITNIWLKNAETYVKDEGCTTESERGVPPSETNKNLINNNPNNSDVSFLKPKPVNERKSKKKMMDESDLQIQDMYRYSKMAKDNTHTLLPEQYSQQAEWFTKASGLAYLPKFMNLWISGFEEWSQLGVIEEDVVKAVGKLRNASLSIISPGSLTKTLNDIVGNRKAKKDEPYNPWR
jgi:hypothetical protein